MFCHTCLKEEVNPEESTALSMLELQQESRHCERDVSSGVSKIGVLTNFRGLLIVTRVSNRVSRLC